MAVINLSGVVGFRNEIFKAGLKNSNPRLKAIAVNLTRGIRSGEIVSVKDALHHMPKDLSKDLAFFMDILA